MDPSKLTKLRQIHIPEPCSQDWDAMAGDEQQRFCAGCGCFVHNVSELPADKAEELLSKPGRVCTRVHLEAKKGILTRDGWIPRLMLAGAVAASVAGCEPPIDGTSAPTAAELATMSQANHTVGKLANASTTPITGTPASVQIEMGDRSLVEVLKEKPQVLTGKPAPPRQLLDKSAVKKKTPKRKTE